MEPVRPSITASATRQDRETEAKVFQTCAKAGACCIGFTADTVLFQEPSRTLAIPLAEFANADRAIELIKAKLADQVQP